MAGGRGTLSPDGIIIITIVVCSCKRNVEEGSTGELSIEVDAVPCEIEVETISELRSVRTTDETLVVTVDLTVTVDIHILDVSDIRTCTVPCRIVDLLFSLIETVSCPSEERTYRTAYELPLLRSIRFVRIDEPTRLCISYTCADSVHERLAAYEELVSVRDHHIDTLHVDRVLVHN